MTWRDYVSGWLFRMAGDIDRDSSHERFWSGEQGASSTAGVPVTRASVLQLDVVQGCLENLGGSISILPAMVYERISAEENKEARDHPLFKLLNRPNDEQTPQEFTDEMVRHLAFERNFYAFIKPGDVEAIGSLEIIHPLRVLKVERGADGYRYYTVRRLAGGGQDVFREDVIWHIRRAPLTEDGLRGKPIYETAREEFGRALAVKQFGALFFSNGTSGGDVLEHPGNFKSKEDEKDFLDTLQRTRSGLNRLKITLLKYGVKLTRGEIKNDEAQFLETLKEVAITICRLWNMPPHRVGILDRATLSNIEQQSIDYVVYALMPLVTGIEQAMGRDLLLGDDRYFVKLNVDGLLRGDMKSRFEAYEIARRNKVINANEWRQREGWNGIGPQGEVYENPNITPGRSGGQLNEDKNP